MRYSVPVQTWRFWPLALFLLLYGASGLDAQVSDPAAVRAMVEKYRKDPRGPYRDIRWFCNDGSTRPARDPCPDKPGNQRARYRDEVLALAKKEGIFLGQILATTPHAEFWGDGGLRSRFRQYQLEQYLRLNDDGWVLRRAQYYRGAIQTEDENAWGQAFFRWLLGDEERLRRHYFLIRQGARDIPHAADNNLAQRVRAVSKDISDAYAPFLDLRVKIHGMPDESDIQRVREFRQRHRDRIPAEVLPQIEQLIGDMTRQYQPFKVEDLQPLRRRLPRQSAAAAVVDSFSSAWPRAADPAAKCDLISRQALALRQSLTDPLSGDARLAALDISLRLEDLLLREHSRWSPKGLGASMDQGICLARAAAAFGFLELWEWEELEPRLAQPAGSSILLSEWAAFSEALRDAVEWGAGMVRAQYRVLLAQWSAFEPLANGFFDDRIRASVLLPLGQVAGQIGDAWSEAAGQSHAVLNIPGQSAIRGLNPGYAMGELVVVSDHPESVTVHPDKIYVFHHPPEDLKPVAGIATVTEGNLVSHVQLLARNLGIPNARIAPDHLQALRAWEGRKVFYAVTREGTVIMKPAEAMEPWEQAYFEVKQRGEEKIRVPVERLRLDDPRILDMRELDATASGVICGPKAANLAQLKRMFPDNVVEGLVLPFALFRQNMEQPLPAGGGTYWSRLESIYDRADARRLAGIPEAEIEAGILLGLDSLRSLIRTMPFRPGFRQELEQAFLRVFGQPIGGIPVFVRSDTNMEDLKDFTGAGLNLTVFNVLDSARIFQGIRDVWASPYAERSFRWRQHYLENPEHVYPSILIIPSVPADHSGVLITKGIYDGDDAATTVAFNRGVGGAVDGQAAETWWLGPSGTARLLAPAREPEALRIPPAGGSRRETVTLEARMLSATDLAALHTLSAEVRERYPQVPGVGTDGPFDVELGFRDGRIWLFQVRPFVENRQAAASELLERLAPPKPTDRPIPLD